MTSNPHLRPFGEESCEAELIKLRDEYEDYYFFDTPFNDLSLDPRTYLIVGRRGSGKSSLAHFFTFQTSIPNARCVDVREPEVYQHVLTKIARSAALTPEIAVPRIARIWSYVIWSLIFEEFKNTDRVIAAAIAATSLEKAKPSRLVMELLKSILQRFLRDDDYELADDLESALKSPVVQKAKNAVLLRLAKEPIIVAIDSLEHYPTDQDDTLMAVAGLIQCASQLNTEFAQLGIHVKVFMTAEIFPYLKESIISNPAKYVRDPLFLSWRPKDLIRLCCWRFHHYLEELEYPGLLPRKQVQWNDFNDVVAKMWIPFFGEKIENRNGISERSLVYLLRHSQLRPRQLVILCNRIASLAMDHGSFPRFENETIIEAVKECEEELADEVLNAYSRIYRNVAQIVEAVSAAPMIFSGNQLDKWAKRRKSAWPRGQYSPQRFRDLLADLGVVGRVRHASEATDVVEADFQYFKKSRLVITETDTCAIHPMFYRKLNIDTSEQRVLLPFPDHPMWNELDWVGRNPHH